MRRVFLLFILGIVVVSLGCMEKTVLEPPVTLEGAKVESKGASEEVSFTVAETSEGENANIITTILDSPPSEDDLLMGVITMARTDACSKGEEDSFNITGASRETKPHDPTIIIYTRTQSGEKTYASWYFDIKGILVTASVSGSDPSFVQRIKCHSAGTPEEESEVIEEKKPK